MSRLRVVTAAALLAVLAAACGGGTIDPNTPQDADNLTLGVTPTLGGLAVTLSEKATTKLAREVGQRETYVRDATVFELRQGKRLRGVFQVMRLTPDARVDDIDFRRQLAGKIIGTTRPPEAIGGVAVYKGVLNQQVVHVWFEEQFLEILIVDEKQAIAGVDSGVDVNRLLVEALSLELTPGQPTV